MISNLALIDESTVGAFKVAAVVIVFIVIVLVILRAISARSSSMERGAHLPLDDAKRVNSTEPGTGTDQ